MTALFSNFLAELKHFLTMMRGTQVGTVPPGNDPKMWQSLRFIGVNDTRWDTNPHAIVSHDVDQPIGVATFTQLQFNTVVRNDYGMYNPGTPDRILAPWPGVYQYGWNIAYLPAGALSRALSALSLAGLLTNYRCDELLPATPLDVRIFTSYMVNVPAPTFLGVQAWSDDPGGCNISGQPGDDAAPNFWVMYMGP